MAQLDRFLASGKYTDLPSMIDLHVLFFWGTPLSVSVLLKKVSLLVMLCESYLLLSFVASAFACRAAARRFATTTS